MKAEILKMFSLIFSYPEKEKIDLAAKIAGKLGFNEIEKILRETDLQELEVEYTSLFVSAHPSIPCPPYQSYFEEGKVYGKASVEAERRYRERGLDYVYESEPSDHIAVELEFLSLHPENLRDFRKWFLKFAECVKKNSAIYAIFADGFEKFLELEE